MQVKCVIAIFSCRGFRICARIYRSNQGFYPQMLTLVPRYRNAFALIGRFMQETIQEQSICFDMTY
jgi:hypothetical protein